MSNIADKFEELGVIPVVVLNDAKDALPLAKALVDGGLPCAEVTFRTAAAEESIRLMHEAYPDMVLAAGTVLTTEQVDRAVAAGASVIVSPGFDPEIVDYCISKNTPVVWRHRRHPRCQIFPARCKALRSGCWHGTGFGLPVFRPDQTWSTESG